jgi:hypothetical protein
MNATDPGQVIVKCGKCACNAVHTAQVHHRHFPEVWAECSSPAEGAAHLLTLLRRFREGACSHYRRDAIDAAIADVEAYLEAPAGQGAAGERPPFLDETDVVTVHCSQCAPEGVAVR